MKTGRAYERVTSNDVPAGTSFRGPTAMAGPETEWIFECLLLTNSE